jgi:homocysteine S-methyltransferase
MDAFKEQMKALKDGGVDLFCLETFADISELQQAIRAARAVDPHAPVFAQVMINLDGHLPLGTPLKWAIQKLDEWGADVIGLNCSVGPQPMLTRIKQIREITKKPIIVQPNAGLPKEVEGRTIYMCTPEYMGEFTKNFLQEGVQFIGGCCGTSPEHIRSMAQAFRQYLAMAGFTSAGNIEVSDVKPAGESTAAIVDAKDKSRWAAKIARGEKVVSVELLPPAGVKVDTIVQKSLQLRDAGIDAINIPDGPRASARMSAILTSVMIEQSVGIETVLHYTCRDRNILGMQSDILGAHAIGLRNLLFVTGDPPKMGAYPNATGVFDIDSIGLVNMASRLNSGFDLGSRSIGEPTAISIGVGVNPVHQNFEYEMKRFFYKVDAGAEWAMTQPVFDVQALYRFMDHIARANIKIPIIAGIWPLLSLRNAQFMNNEVPGVVIPEAIIKRMSVPQSPEDAKKVGAEIAHQMVEEISDMVQGFQISAPFGRIDLALEVVGKSLPAS